MNDYKELNGRVQLVEDADTTHPTAEDLYEDCTSFIETSNGVLNIQEIDSEQLSESDEEIRRELIYTHEITSEEADELVDLARSVYEECALLEDNFNAVIEAYEDNEIDLVLKRLDEVEDREYNFIRDYDTLNNVYAQDLSERLLTALTADPEDAYYLTGIGTVTLDDGDGTWVAYTEGGGGYTHVVAEEDWNRQDWTADTLDSAGLPDTDYYTEEFCREATFATDEIAVRVGRALGLSVVHSAYDGTCGALDCDNDREP